MRTLPRPPIVPRLVASVLAFGAASAGGLAPQVAAPLQAAAPVQAAAGCDCGSKPSVAQARSRHGFVFLGKAVSVTDSIVTVARDSTVTLSRAVFRVQSIWKGQPRRAFTVTSGKPKRACVYPFEAGGMYLVYADGKDGFDLVTSVCTRTAPYDSSSAEIKALGMPAIVPRFP